MRASDNRIMGVPDNHIMGVLDNHIKGVLDNLMRGVPNNYALVIYSYLTSALVILGTCPHMPI
jgi:hypothetical protein